MPDSYQWKLLSLDRVLSELMNTNPAEYHEVRFVALKLVQYFKRPAHEIACASIRDGLRFFPLYLTYERLPLCMIEILLNDAERLLSNAEEMQISCVNEVQTVEASFSGE